MRYQGWANVSTYFAANYLLHDDEDVAQAVRRYARDNSLEWFAVWADWKYHYVLHAGGARNPAELLDGVDWREIYKAARSN